MMLKTFALSLTIVLFVSAVSHAGDSIFTRLGRYLGYGISDGYHAQRYCTSGCTSCSGAPSVQHTVSPGVMQVPAYAQPVHRYRQVQYPIAPLPLPAYQTLPSYGQPVYGKPVYGNPVYGNPVYGQPTYHPQFAVPTVATPGQQPLAR